MGIGSFALPITTGGTVTPDYVYPSDWISISGVPNNEIYLCTSDEGSRFVSFTVTTASGTYSVDWGDGTSTTGVTSGTAVQYQLPLGSGTTSPNTSVTTYKTRIYATGTITRFFVSRNTTLLNNQYFPIYAANFGTTGLTSMANMFFVSSAGLSYSLQAVYLPSTLDSVTTMASAFEECRGLIYLQMPTSMSTLNTLARTFFNARSLIGITFPSNLNAVTSMLDMAGSCFSLTDVTMPTSMTGCTQYARAFATCQSLESITFPTNMNDSGYSFTSTFQSCSSLKSFTFPNNKVSSLLTTFTDCFALKSVIFQNTNCDVVTTSQQCFQNCNSLSYVEMPTTMTGNTTLSTMFSNCFTLGEIDLPPFTGATNASSMFAGSLNLGRVGNGEFIGRSGNTFNGGTLFTQNEALTGYTGYSQYTAFGFTGTVTIKTKLQSLRLINSGSTYSGTSPQINISYNDLGQAALVEVFNDLPTLSGKTINITGCTGAAALTAPERAIATGKGWTITG